MPVETIKLNYQQAMEEANQAFSALGDTPRHPLANQPYLIEEAGRPGQLMPILEDEHGTYIMNSKDLRAVEHIERLVKIGVNSLKIEGRTKSIYYVARTAQVYRQAIDDAVAGRPFDITCSANYRAWRTAAIPMVSISVTIRRNTRIT